MRRDTVRGVGGPPAARAWRVALAALAAGASACLRVPQDRNVTFTCASSADCDQAAGQVCDEGVCWGGAALDAWAAAIGAPSTGSGLVAVERPALSIPADGWLGDLALEAPLVFSGTVEAACTSTTGCGTAALAATITISRPSLFSGGPGFRVVAATRDGADGASFSVEVPRSRGGDPPFVVTVVPSGRNEGPQPSPAPAELAPPARRAVALTDPGPVKLQLGGRALPTVSGTVLDALNRPLARYRVVALGRWETDGALAEVSTVAYTDASGNYRLVLAENLVASAAGGVATVELVASPPADVVAPTLHLAGVPVSAAANGRVLRQPTGLDAVGTLVVPVVGPDSGGAVGPVVGARVIAVAESAGPLPGGGSTTYEVEDVTDADGRAHLPLVLGELGRAYRLSIIPPATSPLSVVFDEPLAVQGGGVLAAHLLTGRIPIRGRVIDADGVPVGGVAVTAHPSPRFAWRIPSRSQQFLAAIPQGTTTTTSDGGFAVFVDPILDGSFGVYDLDLEPPKDRQLPAWQLAGVAVPPGGATSSVELGDARLPPAAFLHGRVVGPDGAAVADGEVRLFQLAPDTSACALIHAPSACTVPAVLRGRATADEAGVVRLIVPTPDAAP